MTITLTDHERRILAHLDQHGSAHRRNVVWDLASPESKLGRCRDNNSPAGGGSSGNGEAMIMANWCQRLVEKGFVVVKRDSRGFYLCHSITAEGRRSVRAPR